MPEQSKRGRAQDRAKVAGGQKHETSYEAKKTGRSTCFTVSDEIG